MSAISMMELNAKSPFFWDWENLVMYNTKTAEEPKKLQLDSEIEGIEGFEVGSFYSSGGRSDGGTGSDVGYASSSKSSKSASVDSPTDREIRGTQFSLETTHCLQQGLIRSKRDLVHNSGTTRTSPTIQNSVTSAESLIALELGKRTYFEDVSGASNGRNTARPSLPPESVAKKSKSSSLSTESPRCQVEGCNLDLSSAKDYHRKHRVCENHSKSPKVVINGLERRFCQQCSRFHGLSDFDQKKRSCRRRLSDHNARRRKPKPEVIQFNSMRLTSSLYEGRNQLNFAFDQVPMLNNRHGTWDTANESKTTLVKPGFLNTMKSGGTDELYSTHNGLQSPATKVSHGSTQLLPSKGVPSNNVYQQGLPVSVAPSNLGVAQDFRALSLLSTSSWDSCDPEPSALNHSVHANHVSFTQPFPTMHTVPLSGGAPISSDFWQADQQPTSASGFQLFKAPNESSFYLY